MEDLLKSCASSNAEPETRYGMAGSIVSALSLLLAPKKGMLDPTSPDTRIGDATFLRTDDEPISLSAFLGKTVLVVNTASRCAFKNQISDLQSVYEDLGGQGLAVLALPSNDFGNQEPCDDDFVRTYYRSDLSTSFALAAKVSVRGRQMHPFFSRVAEVAGRHALPKWNFYKYVIAPNGHLAAWFSTPIKPSSSRIRRVIEECLSGTDAAHDQQSRFVASQSASS